MGGADIIPGVSGGTVALILGIYPRLVAALSAFDLSFLKLVSQKKWREALAHIDFWFLLSLGLGIGLGILCLASLMHILLTEYVQFTLAAFFGLILASSFVVARLVKAWGVWAILSLSFGACFAFWLVGQLPSSGLEATWYYFVCGAVAICAMILPGISGAFILLLMGKYAEITGILRALLHGEFSSQSLVQIIVFILGCGIGLLSFSKVLKVLLVRWETVTLAALCGFMVGSLRKIWPFKVDLTPEVEKFKLKQFGNVWPSEWGGETWLTLAAIVFAASAVLILDASSRRREAP